MEYLLFFFKLILWLKGLSRENDCAIITWKGGGEGWKIRGRHRRK